MSSSTSKAATSGQGKVTKQRGNAGKKQNKNKKAEALTEKLKDINTEALTELKENKEASKQREADVFYQDLCKSFIKGQGSLYVIEKQNKQMTDNGLIKNGPVFVERVWNDRRLQVSTVRELANINNGRLYPKVQEYAIVVAISASLLEDTVLADYQSLQFPNIVLKNGADGYINIVNGHHRIESLIFKHQKLLDRQSQYQRMLGKNFTKASDEDTYEIVTARETLEKLEKELFDNGGWGAIILDYDAIMAHEKSEEIKAYWARNTDHIHVPDSSSDLLRMILKSTKNMFKDDGYKFMQLQLDRTSVNMQSQMKAVLKNSGLLYLLANLMNIPMFQDMEAITYNRLYKWHKVSACWLEVFLEFARDSYAYLGCSADTPLTSIVEVQDNLHTGTLAGYGIFDQSFHQILEEAYKAHLVPAFIAFGTTPISVNGKEYDWNKSFQSYRAEVLEKIKTWSAHHKRPREHRDVLSLLVRRVTYLLDEGYKVYPKISNLNTSIPLVCNSFILDIGKDLENYQDSMIEFLTLFEPTLLHRLGPGKKLDAVLDLKQVFKSFGMLPPGGVTKDQEISDFKKKAKVDANFEEVFPQIWAQLYHARKTAISIMKTLKTKHLAKHAKVIPPTAIRKKEAKNKEAKETPETRFTGGVTKLLKEWVKSQQGAEKKMTQELIPGQLAFADNDTHNYGCALPPAKELAPAPGDKIFESITEFSEDDIKEMSDCLLILDFTYYSWAAQTKSNTSQHCNSYAALTVQLNKEKEAFYIDLVFGQQVIWELFSNILELIKEYAPSFEPWHGITVASHRADCDVQELPEGSDTGADQPILGAGMAQEAANIHLKFQSGLHDIKNRVLKLCAHTHDGQRYISPYIEQAMSQLFQAMARESMNQSHKFSHGKNHELLGHMRPSELDTILENDFNFRFPQNDNIKTMTTQQTLEWFGGGGVESTFGLLNSAFHGVQEAQAEERRKQRAADRIIARGLRASKVDAKAQPVDVGAEGLESTDEPPPPNQLAKQKHSRKASSDPSEDASVPKKAKVGSSNDDFQQTTPHSEAIVPPDSDMHSPSSLTPPDSP